MPEGNGSDEPTQTPTRVFVVWDTTIDGMRTILKVLRDDPPSRFVIDALSLDPGVGAIWAANVEPGIARARHVLAIVNKPNANVGHEIGYVLGKGKGVRLLVWSGSDVLPPWIERPPFKTQLTAKASDIASVAACVANDQWVHVHGRPAAGDDTLLLCPRGGEGSAIRYRILKQTSWREEGEHGWTLDDLPKQLDGVRRVVWIVMPFLPDAEGAEERDGQENASLAVIAGFASGVGIEVKVWQNRRARQVLDVGLIALPWDTLEDAERLVAQLITPRPAVTSASTPRSAAAILADYRSYVRSVHAVLVPFFASTSNKLLNEIFVELQIDSYAMGVGGEEGKARWSLRELMARPTGSRRFVVLADPGAGKSTVCRHLAHDLAGGDDEPIPVFASLARLALTQGDVFDLAESDLRGSKGEAAAKGLATLLRERAMSKEGPSVWLLLDGLDEVPTHESAKLRNERLPAMLRGLSNATVVITSRAIGFKYLGPSYVEATLLGLDEEASRTLLENWIGADAGRVWSDLQGHPRLAEMARNPLMLTLIAKLRIEGKSMPRTRGRLYQEVIDVLLRRGAGLEPKGVKDPTTTAALLTPLSLALHQREGECWSETSVLECLWDLLGDERYRLKMTTAFGTPEQFLTVVAEQTGILGPLRDPSDDAPTLVGREGGQGDGEPWRYMHRSMREFLAAQALLGLSDRTSFLVAGKNNVQHWGETFALFTGMVPPGQRLEMLEELRRADNRLALRTLPQIEGISPDDVFGFMQKVEEWSGDYLANVVEGWLHDGVSEGEVREALWGWVSDERSTKELAFVYYALEKNDIAFGRAEFFQACGRTNAPPRIDTREIPGGTFQMGSPERVGHEREHPPHDVTLSPFALGTTTITEPEYAAFDRDHVDPPRDGYPVVDVSWWEAWLFSRWIGGSLPTEAQWEYACRAGSNTLWCFGDDENDLVARGWFFRNSGTKLLPPDTEWDFSKAVGEWGCKVHPVSEKLPNAFGLYDMHGNVREWCSDWYGKYAANPAGSAANVAADPTGPNTGAVRVLRGGFYWDDADRTRSAFRFWDEPGVRSGSVGFRVAFPARAVRSRP